MTDISFPALNDELSSSRPSPQTLELLARRRSAKAAQLVAPGPTPSQLEAILTIASRVPDHRKVVPFRFLTIENADRPAFADVLISAARQRDDEVSKMSDDAVRGLAMRAPSLTVLISSPDPLHRTPVWEQELVCGAVGMALLTAATASGFGAQWLTEWFAFDSNVDTGLGLTANERVAGFFYIGTPTELVRERERPSMSSISRSWHPTNG